MSQQQQQQPHLTADLRLALSVLYNLQTHHLSDHQTTTTSYHAHEYLLQFQSRNTRRRLHSQFKGQRQLHEQQLPPLTLEDVGSTWLTCIFLISSLATTNDDQQKGLHQQHQVTSPVQYAEALFAAQTLVHRLRRVKLTEAIDVELEAVNAGSDRVPALALSSFPPPPQFILEIYRTWIRHSYNDASTLTSLLQDYDIQPSNNHEDLEERIKGELSMVLLANVMDHLARRCQAQHVQDNGFSHIRPLLVTLSSALAILAARIRYTPTNLPDPVPNTLPIVQMILRSLVSARQQRQQQGDNSADLYYVCLAAIPDAVLQQGGGGGGGAFGRFSLEPRCYTAVMAELKTQGIIHVWKSLQEIEASVQNENLSSTTQVLLLNLCEAWAKHVPLPTEFVVQTIPLVLQSWKQSARSIEAKAAMAYWIATMESGSLTVEQILLTSLLQGGKGSQQPNKKRQSSRSRKREQQVLEDRTTDSLQTLARNEMQHRGQVACMMGRSTWPEFQEILQHELHEIASAYTCKQQHGDSIEEDEVEGEGPVGALSACAASCLPFILRSGASGDNHEVTLDLFVSISSSIQQMCESPSHQVRSFVSESLYTLHQTLTECTASPNLVDPSGKLIETMIHHFVHSSMNLAARCCYPEGYFVDLGRNNVEELEIERNDVRDVLRTVATIPTLKSPTKGLESSLPMLVCLSVLQRLLELCNSSIQAAARADTLVSEVVLHAFSALAKPIDSAALFYSAHHSLQNSMVECSMQILNIALEITSVAGRMIVKKFPVVPKYEVLPLSRLYNLSVASLSPVLSRLLHFAKFEDRVVSSIGIAIEAAAMSLLHLPELPSPSTLRGSRFDVRGAMRSPGGEDHVGVLTLLRLASESKNLSLAFLRSKQDILLELCGLQEELKKMELKRGIGVFWGPGVLPKSRRILLGVICSLDIVAGGYAQVSDRLRATFNHALSSIAAVSDQLPHPSSEALFQICESVFDIAAFEPKIAYLVFDTFDATSAQSICFCILQEATNFGFKVPSNGITDDMLHQWIRLRAAMFTLLKALGSPDLPSSAVSLLQSLIRAECEAVLTQCGHGPASTSRLFHEDAISDENVPAGLFIQVLVETLSNAFLSHVPVGALRNTLTVLFGSRQYVLQTMISGCSSPIQKDSFYDPRPVMAESWLICMTLLCRAMSMSGRLGSETLGQDSVQAVTDLLVDTFIAVVSLLMYGSLEKTKQLRAEDPGMTLDGPQGLVLMEFLESYFFTGREMLQIGASRLVRQIPVEMGNTSYCEATGFGIVGAVLFRGIQGGLPPWAVENVPSVYASLYAALGKSVDDFGVMLELSMSIRLQENEQFGSVKGGSLLSGRYFEKMNDSAKGSFLRQAKELAKEDSIASWKRLKVIIKQACGGKKKDTDFNQRPALTRWDTLDRL
jgi:hypothetical protein